MEDGNSFNLVTRMEYILIHNDTHRLRDGSDDFLQDELNDFNSCIWGKNVLMLIFYRICSVHWWQHDFRSKSI